MRLIYWLLKKLVQLGFAVFYEKTTRIRWENAHFRGPAIVVANHPSTLMDPLNVVIRLPQAYFFLANYSLFKNPIAGWLLRRLFCIPIKRRQDLSDDAPLQNDESFAACDLFLKNGGCLFVAPEGSSFMERRIRELKTGTARIAFSAESKNDWRLGLQIVPIGLIYSSPSAFRSRVLLNMGEPILVSDWRTAFEHDAYAAVHDLTDFMEKTLKNLTFHCENESDELFQRRLEIILKTENPSLGEAVLFLKNKKTWSAAAQNAPLKNATTAYFETLAAADLTDRAVANFSKNEPSRWKNLLDALGLAFGAPLAAAGAALWFLPCFLPLFVARRLRLYIGYESNVKFLVGLFTFPIFWRVVFIVSKEMGLTHWESMGCVALTVPLGWFAWAFFKLAKRIFENGRGQFFAEKNRAALEKLAAARRMILENIIA